MDAPLLLDTCAAIWIATGAEISAAAADAIERGRTAGHAIYVSPITAWELGLLVSRGRMNLLMPPDRWFNRLLQAPGVKLAAMPLELLIASSFLPGLPPRDPADRILVATAREYDYMLVTRDRSLLDYAAKGHAQVMEC